jgi:ferredoxin
VPYVARWSGEALADDLPVTLRRDRNGIGYARERSFDRDEHGILWTRAPSRPGVGTPQLGKIHSLRQRLAMAGLRCQVCGQPADRSAEGVLWLIDASPDDPSLRRGEERTVHPPVCRPCAHRAVGACPHLRTACVALRVQRATLHGVSGALYVPDHPTPAPLDADVSVFPYGDPRLPWVLASQLVVTLRTFTTVELQALATDEEVTG